MDCHLLLLTTMGSGRITTPGGSEGRGKKILLTTDFSIHEVSSMIGYENTNHFINLFKKYVGSTPGKFRQKALEDRFSSHFPVQ